MASGIVFSQVIEVYVNQMMLFPTAVLQLAIVREILSVDVSVSNAACCWHVVASYVAIHHSQVYVCCFLLNCYDV